jgi:hypothetical protein
MKKCGFERAEVEVPYISNAQTVKIIFGFLKP